MLWKVAFLVFGLYIVLKFQSGKYRADAVRSEEQSVIREENVVTSEVDEVTSEQMSTVTSFEGCNSSKCS